MEESSEDFFSQAREVLKKTPSNTVKRKILDIIYNGAIQVNEVKQKELDSQKTHELLLKLIENTLDSINSVAGLSNNDSIHEEKTPLKSSRFGRKRTQSNRLTYEYSPKKVRTKTPKKSSVKRELKPWTIEDKRRLVHAVNKLGGKVDGWTGMVFRSDLFPNRTKSGINSMYNTLLREDSPLLTERE